MPKTLKVGVVGLGKLGAKHAEVYAKLPGVELVGVCDTHDDKAKDAARRCRTRAFTDYRELVPLVDAASIVVPSQHHFSVSKDFLNHGVHLLIEKPITTELNHADELLDLAHKKKALIQVGHIERFNPAIRAIEKIIDKPRFIECHRLGPYDPRVAAVGVTLDLMIHDIDIVLNLVKSPLVSVDSVGACILSKTEDIANARLRFKNRAVCDLTASRVTRDVQRKIRIFQDNAYISLDYVKQEAAIFTQENGQIRHRLVDIQKNDSLAQELTDFAECARASRKPLVTGEDGRAALALALQISHDIHQDWKRG